VWAAFLVSWFLLTRYFRSADLQRTKNRLLGKEKKRKARPGSVALFDPETKVTGDLLPRLMKKLNITARVRALIEQAGLKWNPVKFVQSVLGSFLVGFWLSFLFLPHAFRWWSLLIAGVAGAIPVLYVIRARNKRLGAFEAIFPDVLEFISRSMRAGHAFSVSLEMIHREFPEPLSGEFRRTFEEHNLGLPLDVALQGLSARVPLLDVHFFVSAVLLQKRTGGNLAEILDKLAYVIRERFKLRGRIKAISAHGRMTGIALTCIPIGVGVLMFFANPDYVDFFFTDDTGHIMLGAAIALQVVGYGIIKKIVSIEV
jgi:tight adherence protein B